MAKISPDLFPHLFPKPKPVNPFEMGSPLLNLSQEDCVIIGKCGADLARAISSSMFEIISSNFDSSSGLCVTRCKVPPLDPFPVPIRGGKSPNYGGRFQNPPQYNPPR